MPRQGPLTLWGLVMSSFAAVQGGGACECPGATVLPRFPHEGLAESCCLNFSGSSFESVTWAVFSAMVTLKILDLSYCNISQMVVDGSSPADLQELYLGGNSLSTVPDGLLANSSHLRVLDLGENFLQELPELFLYAPASLQELRLASNRLSALPPSIFQPQLQRLDLSDNPWDCTCLLLEALQHHLQPQRNASSWQAVIGAPNCASPPELAGQALLSVRHSEVCWDLPITALFVLLPLLLLLALVLCWCCRRKRNRKEATLNQSMAASRPPDQAGRERSERSRRPGTSAPTAEPVGLSMRDALLKNQLMLRPSSALLGSSRDLYEEVEIHLGSEGSPAPPPGSGDEGSQGPPLEDSRPDLETVSVTEVMKDSADREKMYLVQSTEYYSLVPEIELEDSDHAEYESVDLS